MSSDGRPGWPEAVWIGEVDSTEVAAAPAQARLELADADGYRHARFLVRAGRAFRGFVQVPVVEGSVAVADLADAISGLPEGETLADPATPPMSVVIATRDRPALLRQAIDAVLACDYPRFEVVVVDNGSQSTETVETVRTHPDPRVRCIVEPRPGVSRARNRGVRAAVHDHVAFVDDDVVVDRHWLMGLAQGFDRAPDVAMVCSLVPSGEIRTQTQAWFDQRVTWADADRPRVFRLSEPPPDVPLFPFQVGAYGTGASMAVRRDAYERIGATDLALGGGQPTKGGEDIDLFVRMLLAGYALAVEPGAVAWHRHRDTPEALAAQAIGYGRGLGAWLTKIALTPSMLRWALPLAPAAFVRIRALARGANARRARSAEGLPAGYAERLGRLERRSIVTGPFHYLRARWRTWRP